jgi:hypothetical protein
MYILGSLKLRFTDLSVNALQVGVCSTAPATAAYGVRACLAQGMCTAAACAPFQLPRVLHTTELARGS